MFNISVINIANTNTFVNMLPGILFSMLLIILCSRPSIDKKSLYKNTTVKKFKIKTTINNTNCVE